MTKGASFDNRYKYYFCGINNVEYNENCFYDGIVINDETIFQSSMTWEVLSSGLNSYLEQYANRYNFDYVAVIKIPAYYLGWIHRDNSVEPFVPFLLNVSNECLQVEKKIIIPNLIHGMYNRNNNEYVYNQKYNPLYDPRGLHYSSKQISMMYRFGLFELYKDGCIRNECTYNELKEQDDKNQTWNRIIRHYSVGRVGQILRKVRRKIF